MRARAFGIFSFVDLRFIDLRLGRDVVRRFGWLGGCVLGYLDCLKVTYTCFVFASFDSLFGVAFYCFLFGCYYC